MVWSAIGSAVLGSVASAFVSKAMGKGKGGSRGSGGTLEAARAEAVAKQEQMSIKAIKFSSKIFELITNRDIALKALRSPPNL